MKGWLINSDKQYGDPSKVDESNDVNVTFETECVDPGNKWEWGIQDVYNHMGESLEQMFWVFKVDAEDQHYQLDVFEKVEETFQLRLEMKKSENHKEVIDNFKRQDYVPGRGCAKFFIKILRFSLHFPGFLRDLLFHKINMELSIHYTGT